MKKVLFTSIFALIALAALFTYQYLHFHDGKLHVIFCNVGQGDGILIVTPTNKQILVDAGPDKSILNCLSKHMPFWDRTIDIALLTHPHADHFAGYYFVLDQYTIGTFATEELKNKSDGFAHLIKSLQQHHLPIHYVAAGDRWVIASEAKQSLFDGRDRHVSGKPDPRDDIIIEIAGPTREFVFRKNPDGFITNSAESGSLAMLVTYKDFSALLTGDAPIDEMQMIAGGTIPGLDILQIPHHGSDTGIDGDVLSKFQPRIAVISVGKNNYGHPKKTVLDLLQQQEISVFRTDQKGNVDVVSDGKMWRVD